ncbi:hypothetical protein N7507_009346 [Penicillium longicatenatum]|nr:hypothetical protein N7507_009346 [Penicillium longicatenatum]
MDSNQTEVDTTWHIYVGTIATIIPATIAVSSRFAARYVSSAGFWWDDYTIALSLVVNWVMAALRWAQISLEYYGPDGHALNPEKVQGFGKLFMGIQLIYTLNAGLTKTSLLLLYHRIFGVVRGFRWALWAAGAIVIAWCIASTLGVIFGCWPISKLWDPSLPGRCINIGAFGRWTGVANLLIDVLILCLPYPMAWRLQTSVRQKVILSGMFLMGTFVCFISVLRVTSFDYDTLGYSTYKNIEPATWSSIEQSVGIICACLPTLRPLFRWLSGSLEKDAKNRDSALSDFPKQAPLSRRAALVDEENAWGLEDPPVQEEIEEIVENRDGQDRPLSQQTTDTTTSQDSLRGQPEARPESFA